MEMLCLMHEADPRGHLLVNGNPVSDAQLSSLCGVPPAETKRLLAELEAAGVFSREQDGTITSRRMCRDTRKAIADRNNGKKGGNPSVKGWVNPPVNGEDKAQIPESRIQSLFIGVSDARWQACAERQERETGKRALAISSHRQSEPGRYFPVDWPETKTSATAAA